MKRIYVLILALLALAACDTQGAAQPPATAPTPAPGQSTAQMAVAEPTVILPTSAPGKSTVVGSIRSQQTNAPLGKTVVRLAQVFRQGDQAIFSLDAGDGPGAITDEQGTFKMTNVFAAEYVMIVGDVYGKHVVVPDPAGNARIWLAEQDKTLDVGEVIVDLR